MVMIEIENIIASTNLETDLDLQKVSERIPGSEFNPERFPGVIYRCEEPKVVILIFKNGRMMCTAAKSITDIESVMNEIEIILKKEGLIQKK